MGKSSTIDDPVLLDNSLVYDSDWTTYAGDYENLSGEPIANYFNLRRRCWKKDYFTSALPFTQRGDDVRIPLYGSANLVPSGQSVASTEKTGVWGMQRYLDAGLNPNLVYGNLQNTADSLSSPSASSAPVQRRDSVVQTMAAAAQIEQMKAETRLERHARYSDYRGIRHEFHQVKTYIPRISGY